MYVMIERIKAKFYVQSDNREPLLGKWALSLIHSHPRVIFARKTGVRNGKIHPLSLASLCFQFTRGWEIEIDVKWWTNWSSEKKILSGYICD